jgi:hypothetical protein
MAWCLSLQRTKTDPHKQLAASLVQYKQIKALICLKHLNVQWCYIGMTQQFDTQDDFDTLYFPYKVTAA